MNKDLLRKLFYIIAAIFLLVGPDTWIFLLMPFTAKSDCLVENHSQRTVSRVDFYYVAGEKSNMVNIPPNADKYVRFPRVPIDALFVSPDSPYARYDVHIEFSDGSVRELNAQTSPLCFKIIIRGQGDIATVEFLKYGDFGGEAVARFLTGLMNRHE